MTAMHNARRLGAPALGLTLVLSSAASGRAARAQASEPPAAPSAVATRVTPLSEAVAIALRQSPDVLTSQAQVDEAEARRAGVAGHYGPRVHVDANMQQYNSAFIIPFSLPSSAATTPGMAPTPPPAPVPFPVRNAFTWQFSPEIIQPITALWAIYDQYKIQDYGVDVANIKREVARRDVAFQVVQDYYRLLEAQRLAEVAEASVTQLEAQAKEAQSLFNNGVIGKNDLLRAQLALASAKQRAIQTRAQIVLARGALDTTMGLSPDAPLEPVPFDGEPPAITDTTLQSAESQAVSQRLEVREVDKSIAQAGHAVAFSKKKFLPEVNAIANYTHLEGSIFAPPDSAYVGLFASWDVWDWGTTLGGVHEAQARLTQAQIARKKLEDEVRLEARQALVNAQTAKDALEVAKTAVTQAEENYRIVSKKFENNAATSFDVVDAESLLTQARAQVETALYDYLIARAALERATGAPLTASR